MKNQKSRGTWKAFDVSLKRIVLLVVNPGLLGAILKPAEWSSGNLAGAG